MKKTIITFLIFLFVISAAITKNSTKKIEEKIYKKRENLVILNDKYDLLVLEFDYLSSPEKIFIKIEKNYKDEFYPICISELKIIKFKANKINFQNYVNKY